MCLLSPVVGDICELLRELADDARADLAARTVVAPDLSDTPVLRAPQLVGTSAGPEQDPAVGPEDLHHVSVLLRFRHEITLQGGDPDITIPVMSYSTCR